MMEDQGGGSREGGGGGVVGRLPAAEVVVGEAAGDLQEASQIDRWRLASTNAARAREEWCMINIRSAEDAAKIIVGVSEGTHYDRGIGGNLLPVGLVQEAVACVRRSRVNAGGLGFKRGWER